MQREKLVAPDIRVRLHRSLDHPAASKLDGYRVVCLLERLDSTRWKATAQLEAVTSKHSVERATKFAPKILRPKPAEDLAAAQLLALQYVVDCVSEITDRFELLKYARVGIFGGLEWEDGSRFRFR